MENTQLIINRGGDGKNVSHAKWMKRAIFLASLGKNTTSPNPRVGAVIIDKNGKLIAEGFHYKAGICLLYTSPSPRDVSRSRMPSSA